MKTRIILGLTIIAIVLFLSNCKKKQEPVRGCMDPNSTNYNPNATENDGSCTYPPTYTVGQVAGGGVVFYVTSNGQHGLISATTDQSTGCEWGCMGIDLTGAAGISNGTGQQNTNDIINGCSTAGIAARICDQLTLGGYSDWYLPSFDELFSMYNQKNAIGGFGGSSYWSSTETDLNTARAVSFGNGGWAHYNKNTSTFYVRAIRSF